MGKDVKCITLIKKTNLQIQGRRRMRGRRGGVHQDHPVVIINWNFQCHMFAHSGGLGENKNTKLSS